MPYLRISKNNLTVKLIIFSLIFSLFALSFLNGQTLIFSENFESGEMSWWRYGDTNASFGQDYWGIVEGTSHGKAAWCAAVPGTSSDDDLTNGKCWHHYANMMEAYMKRVVSLTNYENCKLIFDYHLSCEQDNDYFAVKVNGTEKIRRSGFVNWDQGDEGDDVTIDLSNYDGKIITIEFLFHSDLAYCIYTEAGAFVDDMRVVGDPKGNQNEWIEMKNALVIQVPNDTDEEWIFNALTSQAISISISVVIGMIATQPIGTICGVIYSLITNIPSVNRPYFEIIIAQDGESKNQLEVGHKFVPICFTYVGGATSEEGIATDIKIYKWSGLNWKEIDSRQILTFDEAFWMTEHTIDCWQILPKNPMAFNELGNYLLVWGNGNYWDGDVEAFVFPDTTNPFVKEWECENKPDTDIHIFFNEDMDETYFNNSTIIVSGSSSGAHSCDFSFDHIMYELIVNPSSNFSYGETVYVTLSKEVSDLAGNGLLDPYTLNFMIEGQIIPEIVINNIETDKSTYNTDDSATLSVSLQNNSGSPLEGASVSYNIKDNNDVVVKTGSCSDKGNGNYQSIFNVDELGKTGTFWVEVTASKSNYLDARGVTTFDVVNPAVGHNLRLDLFYSHLTSYEPGDTASFTLQITNIGNYSEDVTATLTVTGPNGYYYSKDENKGILQPNHSTGNFSMHWSIPSNAAHGIYTVETKASSPSGDEDYSDNKKYTTVGVYEEPSGLEYPAYMYVNKAFMYDENYQIPNWNYKGAWYESWENAPNGHTYKIEIGAYSYANDGTLRLAYNVYKDDGQKIYTGCSGNLGDARFERTNYSHYRDNYNLMLFKFHEFQAPDGNKAFFIAMAVPTTNVNLSPIVQWDKVGQSVDYQANVTNQTYDNPEVWRCNANDQPDLLNDQVLNYFDCPSSPYGAFTVTATPTSINHGTNFAIIAEGERDPYNYVLFGTLYVEHSYDAKVSKITINPSSPRSGGVITITSSIENIGSAPLKGIEVSTSITGPSSYNRSFNTTTDGEDVQFFWDTLGCSAGNYAIKTTISHSQDSNESNNTLSNTVYIGPPPYLIVTGNTDKSSYCVNETVNLSINVKDDSGLLIQGANVSYAVFKNSSLILSGIAIDQANGNYSASFSAPSIPDNYKIKLQADHPRYVSGLTELSLSVIDCISPSITLLSPNGGETLLSGNTYHIMWSSSDDIAVSYIKIEHSIDGGASYSSVIDTTPNTGSYLWTIPNTPSSSCKVKVIAFDSGENTDFDESDSDFSIITSGQLQVVINPQETIDAGAQWKLTNESTWHDSTETVLYPPGEYTLEFIPILGWSKPSDKPIEIISGQTTSEDGIYEKINFFTDKDTVTVPEGGEASFQVRLSAQPTSEVNVTVSKVSGDPDISIKSGASLTLTSTNWDTYQTVTLEAAQDGDAENGEAIFRISAANIGDKDITATEADDETQGFITDKDAVTVPEGGEASFQVRLSAQPTSEVNVTVSKVSGDPDISIKSGASLTLTSTNWDTYQTVTLEAAQDVDARNGEATFRISAANIDYKDVTATEADDEFSIGDIILGLDPSEGTSGSIINVPVEISNNKQELSAFTLEFTFNSGLLDFIEVNVGTLTSDWNILDVSEITPGKIEINGISAGGNLIPTSSVGSVLEVQFQIKCVDYPNQLDSQFKIENYSDDLLGFSPDPCTTNFVFRPCQKLGDVNGDENITPGDAQGAFEIYLERFSPDFCQKTISDVNCNGITTPGDAQDIFEAYLERKTLVKCCAEYVGSNNRPSCIVDSPSFEPMERIIYPLNTIANTTDIIEVPIIVTNPKDIGDFSFGLNYNFDALNYLGTKKGTLTREFECLEGKEEIKGILNIKGKSDIKISTNDIGSLAVIVFQLREGVTGRFPIWILNADGGLSNLLTFKGTIVRENYLKDISRDISLGEQLSLPNGLVSVPLEVSEAFNLKSFGIELKYSSSKMTFVGLNRTQLTKDFVALDSNVVEEGIIRIGGFDLCAIQKHGPGVLVELLFSIQGEEGELEIIDLVDDLENFVIQRQFTNIKYRKSTENVCQK